MLAEFLSAHDLRLFLAAALTSLVGCQLIYVLLRAHTFTSRLMKLAQTVLAGVVLGTTTWFAFHRSLAAFFPFLHAQVPWPSTVVSILLVVIGSIAALAITAFGDSGLRNTALAGSLLSSANSCMLFVSMAGLAAPMTLAYDLRNVLLAMVVGTAVCGFGLRRIKLAPSWRRAVLPATLFAIMLPLLHAGSLAAILPFSDWESVATTPGALSLQPLTVVFGSEFIVVLLLARAGAVVDQKAASRAAQENARLRQLTESTFEGILVHRAGIVLDANGAFCALAGRDLAAVEHCAIVDFAPGFDAKSDGQPIELDLVAAGGEAIPVEMLSRSITLSDGEAQVTAVRDIRERRAAERSVRDRQQVEELQRETEELRERRRIAEEASRAKSAFLAMMSHEIRTPMNAVLGLASSLLDDDLPPEQYRVVTAIRDSGDTLLRILNDVLDFSKLDAGRMSLEPVPFSPATLTEEALSVHGPHAVAKQVVMRADSDPGMPSMLVGDAGRIRQILHNLVSNAVKFTESGEITVEAHCIARSKGAATVEWIVQDTGIGIAPENLATLFDAFVQADSSITRRFGGSGLGLAISKQLVERMGGEISVESRPGHGSRFRFQIDLPLAPEVVTQRPDPKHAAATLREQLAGLGRPLRLLLAEDNPTNQFVVTRLLKDFAVQVDIAKDGQEAVRAASGTRYDLICMDMRMPEMDGLQATRAIRRHEGPSRGVPIVAMTANAFVEDMQACEAAGMTDFVAKPVNRDRLVEAILRALPQRATRREPEIAGASGSDKR